MTRQLEYRSSFHQICIFEFGKIARRSGSGMDVFWNHTLYAVIF